jgi:cytochrome c peroxidase
VEIMAESQLGEELAPEETAQVVAFLGSLTGTMPEVTLPVLLPETGATPHPTTDIR